MGTSSTKSVDSVKLGIQTTIMAIREELMSYFKGTCIERFTTSSNVKLVAVSSTRNYQYERRQAENEHSHVLWIGAVPILTVKQAPDRIIFHDVLLDRSPQLREVKVGIEQFVDKFLMGVEKEYSDATDF